MMCSFAPVLPPFPPFLPCSAVRFPGSFDLLRASKGMEQTPVIFMSAGLPEGVEKRNLIQARSDLAFLEKPFEPDTLLTLMQRLLEES